MFGFAVRETEELMPLPITLAHRLVQRLSRGAAEGRARLPAARRQVPGHRRVRGTAGRSRVETVVVSTQHAEAIKHPELKEAIIEEVIRPVDPGRAPHAARRSSTSTRPAGSSSAARRATPALTGRKIIVDTYGGSAPHGGGAFSGQGPDEGGPLGRLHGPLRRQEHRRGRARRPGPDPARLRDRRRRPGLGPRRDLRHRQAARGEDRRPRSASTSR